MISHFRTSSFLIFLFFPFYFPFLFYFVQVCHFIEVDYQDMPIVTHGDPFFILIGKNEKFEMTKIKISAYLYTIDEDRKDWRYSLNLFSAVIPLKVFIHNYTLYSPLHHKKKYPFIFIILHFHFIFLGYRCCFWAVYFTRKPHWHSTPKH